MPSSGHLQDLLIVGGGLSGALLSSLLPAALAGRTQLWEKSTNCGRLTSSTARGAAAGAVSDLGAQYFTAFDAASGAALASAQAAGVLQRLPPGAIVGEREPTASLPSYFAPGGNSRLAEHYLAAAAGRGLAVHRGRRLASLEAGLRPGAAAGSAASWRALDTSGAEAWFAAVVLTLPAPQVLELGGAALARALEGSCGGGEATLRSALGSTTYSSRFACTLHFARGSLPRFASLPWYGRYVTPAQAGGDVLRYIAFETRKQGAGAGAEGEACCPTFTLHSSVELGAAHPAGTPEVQALLHRAALAALTESMGEKEGSSALPLPEVLEGGRMHRWKFSQVLPPVAGAGGAFPAPAVLAPAASHGEGGVLPPLVLAGDGVAGRSNFASCLASAAEALELLTRLEPQGTPAQPPAGASLEA